MNLVGGYAQAYPAGAMASISSHHDIYGYPHPAQIGHPGGHHHSTAHHQARAYEAHHPENAFYQGWMINSQPEIGFTADSYSYAPTNGEYSGVLDFIGDRSGGVRCGKRRGTANKKERRRTHSINTAFTNLRDRIPNVPSDTKLSKIKVRPSFAFIFSNS